MKETRINSIKRWLPRIAVIGLATIIISLIIITPLRRLMRAVQNDLSGALGDIIELHPDSITDEAFLTELEQIKKDTPLITSLWLFSKEGQTLNIYNLITVKGSTSEWITEKVQLEEPFPESSMMPPEKASVMMQRDNKHEDTYQQMIGPVFTLTHEQIGWVGITNNANVAANPSTNFWTATVLVGLAGLLVYWLSLPVWVWLDARQRGERALVWAAFVLIGNLVALIAYILTHAAKPQTS